MYKKRPCLSVCPPQASICLSVCLSKCENRARLGWFQGKGAGLWLDVVPFSHEFTSECNNSCLACHTSLTLPVPVPHWIRSCNCAHSLDDNGYHLVTYKTDGGPVRTHDSVVSTWADCQRSLEVRYKKEPLQWYKDSDEQHDIAVFDSVCCTTTILTCQWHSHGVLMVSLRMKEGVAAKTRGIREE